MNWPLVKLGDLCVVKRGTTITQKEAIEGKVSVVGGGLKPTYFHNSPNRNGNTITVSGSGASAGFINFYKEPIFASDCSTVEPKNDTVNVRYIYRAMQNLQEYIYTKLKAGAAQPHVYAKDLANLEIPIPPLAEQKRIAELLDTADRILRLRESTIAKLDELEQSMFVEMFGDLINNPNKWPVKKLGNFIEIVMGQAPHSDQCNKEGKGVVFVKAGEFGIDSPIIREWTIDPLKMAKANDILICVVGATAGKINRSRFECAIGRSVASVRSTSIELNQDYLHSFLKTKILELRNRSQGAAQAVITREMLRDIEIPLPPIAKQIEFVSFLKELRNEQNMFSISSKKMSQLQMSLQYQSFAVN
jgi:type I restriction enzyme S subunit